MRDLTLAETESVSGGWFVEVDTSSASFYGAVYMGAQAYSGDYASYSAQVAATSAASTALQQAPSQDQGFMGQVFDFLGDVAGAIWTIPNTVIGLTMGTVGIIYDVVSNVMHFGDGQIDAWIDFDNGALQFTNSPFIVEGTYADGSAAHAALTLGNVQLYSGNPNATIPGTTMTFEEHESLHTSQYEVLGAFFLPMYALAGVASVMNGGSFFGQGNFLEDGPYNGTIWP